MFIAVTERSSKHYLEYHVEKLSWIKFHDFVIFFSLQGIIFLVSTSNSTEACSMFMLHAIKHELVPHSHQWWFSYHNQKFVLFSRLVSRFENTSCVNAKRGSKLNRRFKVAKRRFQFVIFLCGLMLVQKSV